MDPSQSKSRPRGVSNPRQSLPTSMTGNDGTGSTSSTAANSKAFSSTQFLMNYSQDEDDGMLYSPQGNPSTMQRTRANSAPQNPPHNILSSPVNARPPVPQAYPTAPPSQPHPDNSAMDAQGNPVRRQSRPSTPQQRAPSTNGNPQASPQQMQAGAPYNMQSRPQQQQDMLYRDGYRPSTPQRGPVPQTQSPPTGIRNNMPPSGNIPGNAVNPNTQSAGSRPAPSRQSLPSNMQNMLPPQQQPQRGSSRPSTPSRQPENQSFPDSGNDTRPGPRPMTPQQGTSAQRPATPTQRTDNSAQRPSTPTQRVDPASQRPEASAQRPQTPSQRILQRLNNANAQQTPQSQQQQSPQQPQSQQQQLAQQQLAQQQQLNRPRPQLAPQQQQGQQGSYTVSNPPSQQALASHPATPLNNANNHASNPNNRPATPQRDSASTSARPATPQQPPNAAINRPATPQRDAATPTAAKRPQTPQGSAAVGNPPNRTHVPQMSTGKAGERPNGERPNGERPNTPQRVGERPSTPQRAASDIPQQPRVMTPMQQQAMRQSLGGPGQNFSGQGQNNSGQSQAYASALVQSHFLPQYSSPYPIPPPNNNSSQGPRTGSQQQYPNMPQYPHLQGPPSRPVLNAAQVSHSHSGSFDDSASAGNVPPGNGPSGMRPATPSYPGQVRSGSGLSAATVVAMHQSQVQASGRPGGNGSGNYEAGNGNSGFPAPLDVSFSSSASATPTSESTRASNNNNAGVGLTVKNPSRTAVPSQTQPPSPVAPAPGKSNPENSDSEIPNGGFTRPRRASTPTSRQLAASLQQTDNLPKSMSMNSIPSTSSGPLSGNLNREFNIPENLSTPTANAGRKSAALSVSLPKSTPNTPVLSPLPSNATDESRNSQGNAHYDGPIVAYNTQNNTNFQMKSIAQAQAQSMPQSLDSYDMDLQPRARQPRNFNPSGVNNPEYPNFPMSTTNASYYASSNYNDNNFRNESSRMHDYQHSLGDADMEGADNDDDYDDNLDNSMDAHDAPSEFEEDRASNYTGYDMLRNSGRTGMMTNSPAPSVISSQYQGFGFGSPTSGNYASSYSGYSNFPMSPPSSMGFNAGMNALASANSTSEDNIRVFIRIRPPLSRELHTAADTYTFSSFPSTTRVSPDGTGLQLSLTFASPYGDDDPNAPSTTGNSAGIVGGMGMGTYAYNFDAIFNEGTYQQQVYQVAVSPLVNAVLEGYNATILAYGQTGTGKTFTMEGNAKMFPQFTIDSAKSCGSVVSTATVASSSGTVAYNNSAAAMDVSSISDVFVDSSGVGATPRAVFEIFNYLNANPHIRSEVTVSYIQIYNETLSDLLSDSQAPLQVRKDRKRGVFVEGATVHTCTNVRDVLALIDLGAKNRISASTRGNANSSRSHAVCTLTVHQHISTGGEAIVHRVGKLNLVDLAGSERVCVTGAIGQRLEESKAINQSLSCLGNVVAALSDKKTRHVPYRDSKLTRMLEDSLGGNCKTSIIATISPSRDAFGETLSTVRFAQRAKKVKNNARVNVSVGGDDVRMKYEMEIMWLKQLLASKDDEIKSKDDEIGRWYREAKRLRTQLYQHGMSTSDEGDSVISLSEESPSNTANSNAPHHSKPGSQDYHSSDPEDSRNTQQGNFPNPNSPEENKQDNITQCNKSCQCCSSDSTTHLRNAVTSSQTALRNTNATLVETRNTLNETRGELTELKSKFADANEDNETLRLELDETKDQLNITRNTLQKCRQLLERQRTIVDALRGKTREKEEKLRLVELDLVNIRENLVAMERDKAAAERQHQGKCEDLERLENEQAVMLDKWEEEKEEWEMERIELQGQLEEAEAKIVELEELLNDKAAKALPATPDTNNTDTNTDENAPVLARPPSLNDLDLPSPSSPSSPLLKPSLAAPTSLPTFNGTNSTTTPTEPPTMSASSSSLPPSLTSPSHLTLVPASPRFLAANNPPTFSRASSFMRHAMSPSNLRGSTCSTGTATVPSCVDNLGRCHCHCVAYYRKYYGDVNIPVITRTLSHNPVTLSPALSTHASHPATPSHSSLSSTGSSNNLMQVPIDLTTLPSATITNATSTANTNTNANANASSSTTLSSPVTTFTSIATTACATPSRSGSIDNGINSAPATPRSRSMFVFNTAPVVGGNTADVCPLPPSHCLYARLQHSHLFISLLQHIHSRTMHTQTQKHEEELRRLTTKHEELMAESEEERASLVRDRSVLIKQKEDLLGIVGKLKRTFKNEVRTRVEALVQAKWSDIVKNQGSLGCNFTVTTPVPDEGEEKKTDTPTEILVVKPVASNNDKPVVPSAVLRYRGPFREVPSTERIMPTHLPSPLSSLPSLSQVYSFVRYVSKQKEKKEDEEKPRDKEQERQLREREEIANDEKEEDEAVCILMDLLRYYRNVAQHYISTQYLAKNGDKTANSPDGSNINGNTANRSPVDAPNDGKPEIIDISLNVPFPVPDPAIYNTIMLHLARAKERHKCYAAVANRFARAADGAKEDLHSLRLELGEMVRESEDAAVAAKEKVEYEEEQRNKRREARRMKKNQLTERWMRVVEKIKQGVDVDVSAEIGTSSCPHNHHHPPTAAKRANSTGIIDARTGLPVRGQVASLLDTTIIEEEEDELSENGKNQSNNDVCRCSCDNCSEDDDDLPVSEDILLCISGSAAATTRVRQVERKYRDLHERYTRLMNEYDKDRYSKDNMILNLKIQKAKFVEELERREKESAMCVCRNNNEEERNSGQGNNPGSPVDASSPNPNNATSSAAGNNPNGNSHVLIPVRHPSPAPGHGNVARPAGVPPLRPASPVILSARVPPANVPAAPLDAAK